MKLLVLLMLVTHYAEIFVQLLWFKLACLVLFQKCFEITLIIDSLSEFKDLKDPWTYLFYVSNMFCIVNKFRKKMVMIHKKSDIFENKNTCCAKSGLMPVRMFLMLVMC